MTLTSEGQFDMGILGWIKTKQSEVNERAEQRRWEEQQRLLRAKAEQEEARARDEQERESRKRHQVAILLILENGKIPIPHDADFEAAMKYLPFRFMKSEHLIYAFADVRYLEMRVKREIVGRSAGMSVRVVKGVYVRTGQSRGTPVETDEFVDRGVGLVAITTKHLYFSGERTFRINLSKIVAVQPVQGGIMITRDRASALPECFMFGSTDDLAFVYMLLQTLQSSELGTGTPSKDNFATYALTADSFEFVEE